MRFILHAICLIQMITKRIFKFHLNGNYKPSFRLFSTKSIDKEDFLFQIVDRFQLCQAQGVLMQCPEPTDTTWRNFSQSSDITEEELIKYGWKGNGDNEKVNKRSIVSLGGRAAMRNAFYILNSKPLDSILSNEHGAPVLPTKFTGSISHKDSLAVAVIKDDGNGRRSIGTDIEKTTNRSYKLILHRIMTEKELTSIDHSISGLQSVEEEALLRFSFKESIYKALHPWLLRFIGFHEVNVSPLKNGTATIEFHLKNFDNILIKSYTAEWRRYKNYFITAVELTRSEPSNTAP